LGPAEGDGRKKKICDSSFFEDGKGGYGKEHLREEEEHIQGDFVSRERPALGSPSQPQKDHVKRKREKRESEFVSI